MITITVPPELAAALEVEASRRGVSLQALALAKLRQSITTVTDAPGDNMLTYLGEGVGSIDGASEALSQHCGKRFTDGLVESLNVVT